MSYSPSRNEETLETLEILGILETPEILEQSEILSTSVSAYQRYMRSLASRGLLTNLYLPPITESNDEIQQHYPNSIEDARQIINSEGSSNTVILSLSCKP